jgi:hypothetical protein
LRRLALRSLLSLKPGTGLFMKPPFLSFMFPLLR